MTNEIADCIAKEMKSLVQSEHALLTAQPTTRRKGQMVLFPAADCASMMADGSCGQGG